MPDPSKTEKATPKKRKDERKKGHVAMSKDVISVTTLFGSIVMLRLRFPAMVRSVKAFVSYCFGLASGRVVTGISDNLLLQSVLLIVRVSGPLLAVTALLAVVATMAQTRMLVTAEPLKPKLSKLNPVQGFKKMFSLNSVIQMLMGFAKIIVLMVLIYTCVRDMMEVSVRYLHADLGGALEHILLAVFSMMMKVAALFLVLAGVDLLYQRWHFEREMKMTKDEVKDEYKQMEGDPKVKAKIRHIQRKMAMARMMQQVPEADVIIRNPTHVAVALRYHAGEDEAPVVLAKGLDTLAQRIIDVAESHDITIIENVPLARALYAEVEVNSQIPSDLYEAVAEVMVYLYKLGRIKT